MIDSLLSEAHSKAEELKNIGNTDYAAHIYYQILKITPNDVVALKNLAYIFFQNNNYNDSLKYLNQALELEPDVELQTLLALNMSSLSNHQIAVEIFTKLLDFSIPSTYSNLALELDKVNRTLEAYELLFEAESKFPDCEHLFYNHGTIYQRHNQIKKAIDCYQKAIEINNDLVCANYNLSLCHFLNLDYKSGWEKYHWRWRQFYKEFSNYSGPKYLFDKPVNRLLLYCEQGLGDIIQFVRFIPEIKEKFSIQKIILETNDEYFSSIEGIDQLWTGKGEVIYDAHASILDAVSNLSPSPSFSKPYLPVRYKPNESWSNYKDKMKIGICWTGNPLHPNDINRSIYLRDLQFLTKFPAYFFSLVKNTSAKAYGNRSVDWLKGAGNFPIINMSEHLTCLDRLAIIIQQLDIVISVDTMTAHFAGGMGKKVVVLLPYNPDWRWGLYDYNTDWYPEMTLLRQRRLGDWSYPLSELNYLISKHLS